MNKKNDFYNIDGRLLGRMLLCPVIMYGWFILNTSLGRIPMPIWSSMRLCRIRCLLHSSGIPMELHGRRTWQREWGWNSFSWDWCCRTAGAKQARVSAESTMRTAINYPITKADDNTCSMASATVQAAFFWTAATKWNKSHTAKAFTYFYSLLGAYSEFFVTMSGVIHRHSTALCWLC